MREEWPKAAQPIVGMDFGKRRLAIGWPYWCFTAVIDMDKYGWHRSLELKQLREYSVARLPADVIIWGETPYLSGGVASNPTTTADLAMSIGAVQSAQKWAGFETIAPNTWKAAVVGNGHATKDEIQAWLLEHHPELAAACNGDENAYDAMCIGLYGIMRETGEVPPPTKKPRKKRATSGPGPT